MKLRIIYKIFALAFLAFLFQSRSSGPATTLSAGVTGAPGSAGDMGTCGNTGCHAGGSFSPSLSLELTDGSGNSVTEYKPGESYTLTVSISASGSPSGYGFQAVTLDGANANTGSWSNLGTGVQEATVGDRNYIEHSTPSSIDFFEASWTAPAAGTGEVTIYSAGTAVNLNGTSAGDGTANYSLTLSEGTGTSTNDLPAEISALTIAPNPVVDWAQIRVTSEISERVQLQILDTQGRVLRNDQVQLLEGQNEWSVELTDLPKGLYFLQLMADRPLVTQQVLKL